MRVGDLIECRKGMGVLMKPPRVMKYAGLIGEVLLNGKIKKLNVSNYMWDEERKCWRRNEHI
tara:strand:+ start:2113 stop:2298 length:186 start_codon:yes stop_codon:yes gene_type:complete